MKLGIVVRADDTGLGNQTRELVKMLNPDKILLIDSSSFHNKFVQHYDWYDKKKVIVSHGFPDNRKLLQFFQGINVAISCETFYSKHFIALARKKKVKTILQYNFEFLDYLRNDRQPLPDVLLAPSQWRLDDVEKLFKDKCLVTHLPPPTDDRLFARNRQINAHRHNRILHVAGKAAIYDRNGTQTVIDMLKYSKYNYELVIKSQSPLDLEISDPRVTVEISNEPNREDLYYGYDAMILPRRYAGLCLPMNEALMSGLPVFMTNISPNNLILPDRWLASAEFVKTFMTRIGIDLYSGDPQSFAQVVDLFYSNEDIYSEKAAAYYIGHENFSSDVLKEKYLELINSL